MKKSTSLEYLYNKPQYVNYQIIAGPRPDDVCLRDIVFDAYDLQIRQLDKSKLRPNARGRLEGSGKAVGALF